MRKFLIIKYYYPKNIFKEEKITLIDTFLFNNSFKNGEYIDRYYKNFKQHLSIQELNSVYFIPTFYKIKNYRYILKKIKNSNSNFILKESLLYFKDILKCIFFPLNTFRFKLNCDKYLSFDLKPILKECIYQNLHSVGQVEAFQNFIFAKRLKEKEVKVKLIIDWFENQVIDKGLNMGFRVYYPESKHRGYQVVLDNLFYLCFYPTEQEFKAKVLPKEIFVSGKVFLKVQKQFCNKIRLDIAPAFRYQNLWEEKYF